MSCFERNVPYIVKIKEEARRKYKITTINEEFAGFFIRGKDDKLSFELVGSRMFVIIPYEDIEYMAPSKVYFNKYIQELGEK